MKSFVIAVSAASLAQAATLVQLNPSADVFVSASNAANNYGGAGAIEVSASGSAKGEFQSLLRFDTSSAKASFDSTFGAGLWSVQSVALQLSAASPGNPIFNTNVAGQFAASWMADDTWVEGTGNPGSPTTNGVTWNTLSNFTSGSDQAEGTFSFVGGNSGTAIYSLPLGSGLSGDITSGSLASLRLFAADATVSYLSNARTGATPPVLTITAIPEPATSLLIGPAAILLARRRRR